MYSITSILKGILVIITILSMTPAIEIATAQDEPRLSMIERIHQIDLDSLDAGFRVYYSRGYSERAEVLGRQIAASNSFFRDSLGVDVSIRIALLDAVDYKRGAFIYPYGLPFISGGVTVLPADQNTGAVIDMYTPFKETASAGILEVIESAGYSYEEAVQLMVDLIGLHEIGHEQAHAFGINNRQPWFGEFLASYFAYAYMRSCEPGMALVWDAVTQAGREGYESTYTTLDDLNRLYAGVGVGDYVWYQNVLQDRIRSVYNVQGLHFIKRVKERFDDTDLKPETSAELLDVLEEIVPGFHAWADVYNL